MLPYRLMAASNQCRAGHYCGQLCFGKITLETSLRTVGWGKMPEARGPIRFRAGLQIRDEGSLGLRSGHKNWREEMDLRVTTNIKLIELIRCLRRIWEEEENDTWGIWLVKVGEWWYHHLREYRRKSQFMAAGGVLCCGHVGCEGSCGTFRW